MAGKRKGLGRGLDALLGTPERAARIPEAAPQAVDSQSSLPVELLTRGRYQPRQDMRQETLQELAESIRAQGLIQPIVVRPIAATTPGGARYEIIAGERRWRAAQLAGLADVPVVIREVPDEAAVAMALIENIQREDLNPLEEAQALQRLISEFELTHEQAARAVGRSRAAVSNLLRLTELGADAQTLLRKRELEMGHARALLGVANPREQADLARQVVARKLSVRETERLVKAHNAPAPKRSTVAAKVDPDIRRLENELTEKLGAKVSLQPGPRGKGKLVVEYHSLDELEGILGHIR